MADHAPGLKWDVVRIKARLEAWASRPALPASLEAASYVSSAGDYYSQIAGGSEGEQWEHFPLAVFLGSAPEIIWQQGAREAYDYWTKIVPMRLVAHPEMADIRFGWEESVEEGGHAGEEQDWVQMRRRGAGTNGARYAVIVVALDQPWSKDEMRAICWHEFGHALGIKGHSDSKKDIMYFELRPKYRLIPTPVPYQLVWRSLPKQPSQRDLNTLIRLYNSAGAFVPYGLRCAAKALDIRQSVGIDCGVTGKQSRLESPDILKGQYREAHGRDAARRRCWRESYNFARSEEERSCGM